MGMIGETDPLRRWPYRGDYVATLAGAVRALVTLDPTLNQPN